MIKNLRFRHMFMVIGCIMVALLYIITDPHAHIIQDLPFGANTIVLISTLLKAVWFVSFLHASRRAILDYMDLESVIKIAIQTPEGAGKIVIGVGVMMIALAIVIAAAVLSN